MDNFIKANVQPKRLPIILEIGGKKQGRPKPRLPGKEALGQWKEVVELKKSKS